VCVCVFSLFPYFIKLGELAAGVSTPPFCYEAHDTTFLWFHAFLVFFEVRVISWRLSITPCCLYEPPPLQSFSFHMQ
jgi:hypothetical protein